MRGRALRELAGRWWAGELGLAGRLLDAAARPLEATYRAALRRRNHAFDAGRDVVRLGVPVISVGNLAVGGAGKTPVSAWLLRELLARGRAPALLHGGYAEDEPELHRAWAPGVTVVAGRNRAATGAAAIAAGADVLVLDDGFQHRRLARDLDLVLIAAERWTEPQRLLPRGPWREDAGALRRAHVIGVTRRTATAARAGAVAARLGQARDTPVLRFLLRPDGWAQGGTPAPVPRAPSLAVAGIADPGAFVDNAGEAGAEVRRLLPFPDHHGYDEADAREILAASGDDAIVTTEKDWVKLRRLLPAERVWVLRQAVELETGAEIWQTLLDGVLA